MRSALAAAFITLAAFAAPGIAANGHGGHGDHAAMPSAPAPADAQMIDGLVKKVDKAAAKVTLAHGPLEHLGMTTPMTMVFRVKDAAWLDRMKAGDKIRFVADKVNGAFTVVQFEPAQ